MAKVVDDGLASVINYLVAINHHNALESGLWPNSEVNKNLDQDSRKLLHFMHSELVLADIYTTITSIDSTVWPTDMSLSREYAAGLFDGEGHAGIAKTPLSSGRNQYMSRVQIAMREEELLKPFVVFGGRIKYIDNTRWNKNARGLYSWSIHAKQAETFLLAILPSLKNITKKQAVFRLLQIEFLRKRPGGNIVDITREPKQELLYRETCQLNSGKVSFKPIKQEKYMEAMSNLRRNLIDDSLSNRSEAEVALASCVIRIADFAGSRGYDLGGAVMEKLEYNKNRAKEGGKKF
ncbi:MAG: hypothetical protein DRQ47_00280 [Gammaproteobacteria bacterium]|nr:MAG: hypothetical protein DRQ47_00280 [Gammaproteobacteria bacterium]